MLNRSFLKQASDEPLLAYTPMFHSRLFQETETYRRQHFEPIRHPPRTTKKAAEEGGKEGDQETEEERNRRNQPYLDGNPSLDRPLIVQFCANEPSDLLAAARHVEPFCDAVDLNLGCPQGIARKGRYGSFLQEEPELIYKLINTLHENLRIPVTAKFRIQETKEQTLEYARMMLSAGASILTVHGRRREQKSHNTGLADWGYIRYLRENLPRDTVIFANGNILGHGDLARCLDATGVDGVMSAEGALSDPTLFAGPPTTEEEKRGYWRDNSGTKEGYRMDFILRRYMDIIYKYVLETEAPERAPLFDPTPENVKAATDATAAESEANASTNQETQQKQQQPPDDAEAEAEAGDQPPRKKQKRQEKKKKKEQAKEKLPRCSSPNLIPMQGHLFQLLRPLVSRHTHVRDALAAARPGDIAAFEHVVHLVDEAVKSGLCEYATDPVSVEQELRAEEATMGVDSQADDDQSPDAACSREAKRIGAAHKRPWWVCQPYVRPLPEEAMLKGALSLKKKDVKQAQKEEANGNTSQPEPQQSAAKEETARE